jgi:hypothetical protein
MGVDCKISLPQEVRVGNVASVIGILLGNKVTLNHHIGHSHPYVSAEVEDVSVTPASGIPSCVYIKIENTDQGNRQFLYHMEWTRGTSKDQEHNVGHGRGIMIGSTAENIAMGIRLVKFFGGEIDFNDCDEINCNIKRPKRKDITACNGKSWDNFQKRIAKVKPLTLEDIWDCEKFASYKTKSRDELNLEYIGRKTLYKEKKGQK